jgi:hypothetical protein
MAVGLCKIGKTACACLEAHERKGCTNEGAKPEPPTKTKKLAKMNNNNKAVRQLIDAAYMYAFSENGMSFNLTMHVLCEGVRRFYFHKARVTTWEVSVWEGNAFEAYPKRMILESQSGLRLVYEEGCRLRIYNPKRVVPSRSERREVHYCQQLINEDISFVKI